jgi:RNA polymerase sigma-70 factor (ECF subfamily)
MQAVRREVPLHDATTLARRYTAANPSVPRTLEPSVSKPESESVLARIASGDASAVQECLDLYGNLVWSLARRFTRSAAEAEDAVQEVFLDVWKSAARFDPARASEKTFVAMIARRRLIDLLRRAEARPELVPIPEHLDFADDEHQRIEESAELSLAERALAALRPDQRRVLLMSVYQGMSHGEIVSATGIPLGTVKSHIRRGLAEVRNALQSPGQAASDQKVSP